jgi:putative ABC transport system substrate-binding protein
MLFARGGDAVIDRRRFIGVLAGAALAAPRCATAQQSEKAPRVGCLMFNSAENAKTVLTALREVLQERGWIEGKTIRLEYRYAEGSADRLPALVRELIDLKVDIIVAASSASTRAAKAATRTIPIVMLSSADAIGEGFVTSVARPGGNITGMTFLVDPEIAGKQLELLKEAAPKAARVAVLVNPRNDSHAAFAREARAAAGRLGTPVHMLQVRTPEQLDETFATMSRERGTALLVLTDAMFWGQRRRIVELAAKSGVPAMYSQREFVDAGGLVSYGPSLVDMSRRAAVQVDKILRGAKVGELPVEQPTKFELVLNLKTATALGLTIPPSLLLRADQVIE